MSFDILLLEDDDEVIAMVRGSLVEQGLSLHVVRTGIEAFARVTEACPDAVIADAGIGGDETRKLYQVMRHLAAARTVPFLFLGSADEMPGGNLSLAADDFLAKPFSPPELREKITRLKGLVGKGGEAAEEPAGIAECSVREVLVDTIEFLVAARRTGMLAVAGAAAEGRLFVEKGVLRHASFGALRGEEALLRLLELEDVEVSFREAGGAPAPNLYIDWKEFASSHC